MRNTGRATIPLIIPPLGCLIAFLVSGCMNPGQNTNDMVSGRFIPVDIYVDPGNHQIAAYQIEIEDTLMVSSIVGIEGGEHPAFREPPHYDPSAIHNYRIILASFSLNDTLPLTKTRIATIHLLVDGKVQPGCKIIDCIAAGPDGSPIAVNALLVYGEEL